VPDDTTIPFRCDSRKFRVQGKTGVDWMNSRLRNAESILVTVLAAAELVSSQAGQQSPRLLISGQSGQVPVLQIKGRSYVDIDMLARLANGSLRVNGNQITLTIPASSAGTPTPPFPGSQPASSAFSKDFLKAGVEEMTVIREWRTALVSAVQNGHPVTDEVVASYRGQATTNLRLASIAASTDSDHAAVQLLSNELDNMQKLSNKFLDARKNMNYISPDALNDDPLHQQILSCARSLVSMAASGQFQDDVSCHSN
jgi:hypothetical protein